MVAVTAILLSYQRQLNMSAIVQSLRNQTIPVEVWLINNHDVQTFGADKPIIIPWNAGEWARYVFAGRPETEFVMFQDDDFMVGDDHYLEDAIQIHGDKCPSHLLGVAGRGLQPDAPHYAPDIVSQDGYASILKGHFQLFRPEVARRVRMPRHPSASDIYWSLDIGNGEPMHWVSKELSARLMPMDRHGVGYEFRPTHYHEREQVCSDWMAERV